jgi:hypothetical protein
MIKSEEKRWTVYAARMRAREKECIQSFSLKTRMRELDPNIEMYLKEI